MLPWLDHTIAGTTDSNSDICLLPKPSDEEVEFILDSIKDYLTVKVTPRKIMHPMKNPTCRCENQMSSLHGLESDPWRSILLLGTQRTLPEIM